MVATKSGFFFWIQATKTATLVCVLYNNLQLIIQIQIQISDKLFPIFNWYRSKPISWSIRCLYFQWTIVQVPITSSHTDSYASACREGSQSQRCTRFLWAPKNVVNVTISPQNVVNITAAPKNVPFHSRFIVSFFTRPLLTCKIGLNIVLCTSSYVFWKQLSGSLHRIKHPVIWVLSSVVELKTTILTTVVPTDDKQDMHQCQDDRQWEGHHQQMGVPCSLPSPERRQLTCGWT